jgi:hypothetical protein
MPSRTADELIEAFQQPMGELVYYLDDLAKDVADSPISYWEALAEQWKTRNEEWKDVVASLFDQIDIHRKYILLKTLVELNDPADIGNAATLVSQMPQSSMGELRTSSMSYFISHWGKLSAPMRNYISIACKAAGISGLPE